MTYKRLFSVEIWHDYFLNFWEKEGSQPGPQKLLNRIPGEYELKRFLRIRPSGETMQFFENFDLRLKETSSGLEVYAPATALSNGEYRLSTSLDQDSKFSFELLLQRKEFLNITNLPLQVPKTEVLYFSNLTGNNTADGLYLSKALPEYDATATYPLGALVKGGGQTGIYESIRNGSVRGELDDTEKWKPFEYYNTHDSGTRVEGIHAASEKDVLRRVNRTFYYDRRQPPTPPNTLFQFELKDAVGNAINLGNIPGTNIPLGQKRSPSSPDEPFKHVLSLDRLPEGYYTFHITGEPAPIPFYLSQTRDERSILGLFEIFSNTPLPAYQFLEQRPIDGREEQVIKACHYKVRFKNRSTRWRYFAKGNTSTTPDKEIHQSLTKSYVPIEGNLPNPAIDHITVSTMNGSKEVDGVFSDVYLLKSNI